MINAYTGGGIFQRGLAKQFGVAKSFIQKLLKQYRETGSIAPKVRADYSLMGATDGLTFEAFISQKLVPQLWKGTCVLMDNCSVHLGETVRELIEAAGARLIYLPPYSPDFSPIENCWSKIKSRLKSIGARTYPDLVKAIEYTFSEVSLDDIRSWFTHCCYCASED
ncbi:transposase [Leptolyngbya cf. ectocarpi LEGE 11479]|uniref:Transposase n=1 Tax=Leptolyngbya cf. ectocarpi LEGE 11479 TaxID=1828722 RepID=A0A928X2K8_LEPEC|nr:transposase [Leptolyngbya cf. ectocarpi LEGE 11479]